MITSTHSGMAISSCTQRKTPNTVTRVTPLENDVQYIARVELQGPRGGKFVAHVRKDGSCRKI